MGIRRYINDTWTWKQIHFAVDTAGNVSMDFGGGKVPVANGGTGAANAADARTNLGLGGIAVRPNYIIQTTTPSSLSDGQICFVYE